MSCPYNSCEFQEYRISALILAGGKGCRMSAEQKKQYMDLAGRPVLQHTLETFANNPGVHDILLVVPEKDHNFCLTTILKPMGIDTRVELVCGGKERQNSVLNGLEALALKVDPGKKNIVLIHDGVRPFAGHLLLERCIKGAVRHRACVPGLPVTDTIKKADHDGFVRSTVNRGHLFQVQTPQAFDLDLILRAHRKAAETGVLATDDGALVEQMGEKVFITEGVRKNIKITEPGDLDLAAFFLSRSCH
ncbi:MAG: 2-C-methyl-D-erythritol 4-phosphate cytidylyltransferase [Thermodesulfobacteriota bacterium]|nr:2-C-methyl-D-erythritol 4-phosphate cytidylyltransferase [Thermodesulfobacteriota bacterium]